MFWSCAHTRSALEGAISVHHLTLNLQVKMHYLRCLGLLPLAFLLEGRKFMQCRIEWLACYRHSPRVHSVHSVWCNSVFTHKDHQTPSSKEWFSLLGRSKWKRLSIWFLLKASDFLMLWATPTEADCSHHKASSLVPPIILWHAS